MKIRFIGTGAADHDWSRYGSPDVLGSAATLIDDHILIDCGPTVAAALKRFDVDTEKITDILITHNHSDHFDLRVLKELTAGRKVWLHGSPQVCQAACAFCQVHTLHWGVKFRAGVYEILPMESNHAVDDPTEETYCYLFSGEGKNLLYALDTAWFPSRACKMLGKTRLDAVVWDATMSEPGDWRIFDHSDGLMFNIQRQVFIRRGNMDENTKIFFDHRARTLWPADPEEQEKIARRENVLLAHEGETVII
ncbi:MAG: MBL fold metallo-hydrolase [Lentisphaeria bacterium]|nr:MBL fold metallo-hydrolase [Lentisphaeria bacterium]